MLTASKRRLALSLALAYPLLVHADQPGNAPLPAPVTASPVADGKQSLPEVEISGTRQKLDAARSGLSPSTGSTVTRLNHDDIKNLPLGDSTPLNQLLLQTPGVVQDSYGQLHVRGDHGNVQYRINGVVIPESISGFGQALETRFTEQLSVLTGALPAQYGYRTAAIVDIQSKGENGPAGGALSVTVGGKGSMESALELSGARGPFSYYLDGSLLQNDLGIENPSGTADALHDRTRQAKGFGMLSYVLDPDSRVSLMFGSTNNRFQIPDVAGQTPGYTLAGRAPLDSGQLDANQVERNRFAVLSYQASAGTQLDYQVSVFSRSTDVHYNPDPVGDLQYLGVAGTILRRNVAQGLQSDLSYKLDGHHTVRAGVFLQHETSTANNSAAVFPADASGAQSSSTPITIVDNNQFSGNLWGAYLQDEWRLAPSLTINYGLRYDQVSTVVDEHQWSPRLGVVYDLTPTLRLHAGFARYFTPPASEKIDTTSVQKFLGTTNALPSDANTAVKSERSSYYDVGAAYQWNPQLTLSADAYYRDVRHLQDEGQFGNALIFSSFNYAYGRVYGLDLSANYKEKRWSAYANLSLTHARATQVETGQFNFGDDELAYIASNWVHLDHEQKLSLSGGASVQLDGDNTLSADLLYGSGLRNGFANTTHLPAYLTVNAAWARPLELGGVFGRIDARISVVNLFDRSYELRDGSGIGVSAPQWGQRRTLYLNLSKSF